MAALTGFDLQASIYDNDFRVRPAKDTLAFGYVLPAFELARDFHPLETCVCTALYASLRCQLVTSNDTEGGRGGRRNMPYAYTEQGIAMLSGLLNSQKAIQVSVGIMRAFVEMRKFIANNAALLDRMATIDYRQIEYQQSTDEQFNRVFGYLDAHALPSQKVFFKGEIVDAFALLIDLVQTAEKSVAVVDGYVSEKTLNILSKKRDGVECRLVTYPSAILTASDVSVLESQYGTLQVCRTSDFHDRFLIIDG